jgi:hypothetical protein
MDANGHRYVHLVGSLPAGDAEQAMREAITRLGDRLRTLADGETGERLNWVVPMVLSLRDHPDLEVVKDGDFADYRHAPTLRVRRGHTLRAESLDFGQVAAFRESFPVFRRLTEEAGLTGLAFQVGFPGDLDMAMFSMGPVGALRHRRAFTEATLAALAEIHREAGDSVLFQLELPGELVTVAQAPRPLRAAMAALLAKGAVRLAARAPVGARFGIHLCVGDMGNQAFGRLPDASPIVALANAIARRWPAGRTLEYVHAPFAAGEHPAPLAEEFYLPLAGLRLPAGTRFAAGFVHEDRELAEHQRILATIERHTGYRVDVATACGLGRRTPENAHRAMDLLARLA